MPKAFSKCVAQGGRVRTVKKGKKKYQHVCFKGDKMYRGETKTKKGN